MVTTISRMHMEYTCIFHRHIMEYTCISKVSYIGITSRIESRIYIVYLPVNLPNKLNVVNDCVFPSSVQRKRLVLEVILETYLNYLPLKPIFPFNNHHHISLLNTVCSRKLCKYKSLLREYGTLQVSNLSTSPSHTLPLIAKNIWTCNISEQKMIDLWHYLSG